MKKILSNIYVKNLLAAVAILLLLFFIILKWLDAYTMHGESVEIPDVKGLTVEKAERVFAGMNLSCQVSDSAFYKEMPPGAIIETIPTVGSKVKKGRTVFLRINSVEIHLVPLPDVKDMSQRQALAVLRSFGFEKIKVRPVPGQFRDLVVGLENRGVEVKAGEKIPLDAPLELLVASGGGDDIMDFINDTIANPVQSENDSDTENWY
jgi:hypothetical protein